ncbi:MAG: DUF697 domain-containing protein [Xenococcaceae cyanobacterium MO_188.B32]|nr:DUF697 domain-containing protein [Xenococcaceae cyanobacterium MO_188.B32]
MTIQLRKPILVTGLGLSILLWLGDSLKHSIMDMGEWTLLGLIATGGGFWLLQKRNSKPQNFVRPLLPIASEEVEKTIAQTNHIISLIETESPDRDIAQLKEKIERVPNLRQKQDFSLAITGSKQSGKTSLKPLLGSIDRLENIEEIETEDLLNNIETDNKDLVLFLVAGDLSDSQWQIIRQLREARQRVLLVFNKQDQYTPEERIYIQKQLQQRVSEVITPEDIVSIATVPNAVKVIQQQKDGSVKEWMEQPEAEIGSLIDRLTTVIIREKEQILLGTTWREAIKLKQQAKTILNEIRRDRALPIIEQYQWIAAGAAFANPVAALDLLATAAVTGQMLVDLSGVYQQKFSLEQGQTAASTLGKLMVQLGLVELSTQAIAGILKSNAFTYAAGGALQGISAAYLTRIAGLSLVAYFQEQEAILDTKEGFNLDRLTGKLKQVFQDNQRKAFLQSFVKQGIARFSV